MEDKEIYTLTAEEMISVGNRLELLDKLHEENVKGGVFLDLPDRMDLLDTDYVLMGRAVFIDGYWAFEAVTVEEREKKGKF